ncbi:hypothetical protein [Paracoccus niistensis]|uniref:Uncharacterized protein n=1 Tax=Paracoccus niistensis TaxID=632935 RepID=A0ABV6I906_9RHOB
MRQRKGLRGRLAAAMLVGCLAGTPAMLAANEASDLIFADRGPWNLADRTLTWSLVHKGPASPAFVAVENGQITMTEVTDPSDGKPVLQLEQKATGRNLKIGRFPVSGGDPSVVFFLESTTRDMATLTGGNPDYIRNRIKDAVFRGGVVARDGGVTTVVARPFEADPNRARMGGFETLQLRFVLGEDPKAPIREMVAETAGPVAAALPREMAGQVIAPAPYRHAMVLQ